MASARFTPRAAFVVAPKVPPPSMPESCPVPPKNVHFPAPPRPRVRRSPRVPQAVTAPARCSARGLEARAGVVAAVGRVEAQHAAEQGEAQRAETGYLDRMVALNCHRSAGSTTGTENFTLLDAEFSVRD